MTGKSKFKSFCALALCLAFLTSLAGVLSPPVSASAPRAVGNPVLGEGAVPIAGGISHSLALRGDGTVWAWGYNSDGRLGDNTTTDKKIPVRVLGMENAVAVAGGCYHSLALRGDGTVWAWGYNANGQLGDNTTTERHTPVRVLGMDNAVAVVGGYGHSLALRGDGTVWAWGYNSDGQLGDNTTTDRHTPVKVSDLPISCQVWFEWGETTGYGNSTTKQEKTGVGSFSANLSGLTSWTTYYFRAVVQNSGGISYGGGENFKTTDSIPPATPEVSSSTHPEGIWTNNFSPSFSWAPVGGPSPVTFYYKLEGYDDDWQSTSGTGESYAGLRDGPYTFEVYAVDTGGTGGIDNYTFKVDTSAPSVQLSGTLTGKATATVGGWQLTTSDFTLTLSMTVSDISDVTVYVNGQSVPVVGGSFSKAVTLSGGTNNFTIMVVDSAGNSTTRTLAVTQTVPAPPVAPPAGPAPEMLVVIVVIVLIISGAAVIFVFVKPPEK